MTTPLTAQERDQIVADHFSQAANFEKIYLANHSLGRPLDQTVDKVSEFLSHWFSEMDESWDPWMQAAEQFQTLVAKLLGWSRPDCIIPKTSAGQGLRAVLNSFPTEKPVRVVTTTLEFDSVDTILRIYRSKGRAEITFVEPSATDGLVPRFDGNDVANTISPDTDLVVFSAVNFTTGQIMPNQEAIVRAAKVHDAKVLADTYHSFGVLPQPVHPDVDFAIGGSYKYVHGGPGACWLAIAPHIADNPEIRTLDTGWYAKEKTFGYERADTPKMAGGGRGWWESTPPVITLYQALAGLEFLNQITVEKLRATSLQDLQDLRQTLSDHPIHHPDNPQNYGAFTLLPQPNAAKTVDHLKSKNIIVDARGSFVRLCPDLLNTKKDFDLLAEALSEI